MPVMTEEERVQHLETIKARIRRSLDDPRPDLTSKQVDVAMRKFMAKANKEFDEERRREAEELSKSTEN
jgi:hypothetical protein